MFPWEMFDALFEQNKYMAVIYLNEDGIITYTNDTYLRILQLPRDQVVGKHVLEITPHSRAYIALKTGKAKVGYKWVVNDQHTIGTALPILNGNKVIGVFGYTLFLNIWDGKTMLDEMISHLNMYKDEVHRSHQAIYNLSHIIGKTENMVKVKTLAAQVSCHPLTTVLITGESGTGKELFAHAIHNAGGRSQAPFVRVNCAAIPENLIEAELFGYDEGAYTGARKGGKLGKFELADKGTIFLDEVAEIPYSMQSKLLFTLQEQVVERLGGVHPIKINVRVITATNRDLAGLVEAGLFRQDLYYRLNVVHLQIPPLRSRIEDIPEICTQLIRKLSCRLNTEPKEISERAMQKLCRYHWPGNVRELENVLERSLVVAEMDGSKKLSERHISLSHERFNVSNLSDNKSLKAMLEEYEKVVLINRLEGSDFHVHKVAKDLDIDPSSLYRKLKRYKICKRSIYAIPEKMM